MKAATIQLPLCAMLAGSVFFALQPVDAADYTPGDFHNYTHASGDAPRDVYQYSVYVPKDYDLEKAYPVVFYLHGGGRGRSHPDQGKTNMVSARLRDNVRTTDAGYSKNDPDYIGYILVSPVKPIATWNARKFGRLYDHVKSKVSIDEKRVCVTGFSMGGQGTWHVGGGSDVPYKLAAMMPLGAWGCDYVKRGTTPETCKTLSTAVWVLHCPQDPVSMITQQLTLFQSHIDCGGYGRFTMIPGRGHISRPRNDAEFFSMRMSWMLAQTHGTPFNFVLRVNDGTIAKVAKGERPFTGDSKHYGFYEPGTVISIEAPASKDGLAFVRWASDKCSIADASSRTTTLTTASQDQVIRAVYADQSSKLVVNGGSATPASPMPGEVVSVTADADTDESQFAFWKTDTNSIGIANPVARKFRFVMPAKSVTLATETKGNLPKRRGR